MIGVLLPTFKERYEGYDPANKRQLRLFGSTVYRLLKSGSVAWKAFDLNWKVLSLDVEF